MSASRGLLCRIAILLLAGYMCLAQPGVPPCWLEAHACAVHPHFSQEQAEAPHSHDYLLDLARSSTAGFLPVLLTPISLLIELLGLTLLLCGAIHAIVNERQWLAAIEPPPPRSTKPLGIFS